MPGEVLRRGVHDEVDALRERRLQQGSGEGVVDGDVRPGLVGGGGDGLDVGDLERGVGRRLEPDQGGVVAGLDDGLGVGDVDELDLDPAAGLEVRQRHDRAAVGVARRDDLRAVADEVEHGRHGRHAGGEAQAAAALERAEGVLERGPGRVGVAAVLEVAAGDVGRGHRDRHVERCVRLVGRSAGGDGDGAGAQRGPGAADGGERVVGHVDQRRRIGSGQ